MPSSLSKIIYSEVVADEVLFLRKSKAELILTNLKTFDTFVFHNYQKSAVIMNRRRCQKFLIVCTACVLNRVHVKCQAVLPTCTETSSVTGCTRTLDISASINRTCSSISTGLFQLTNYNVKAEF